MDAVAAALRMPSYFDFDALFRLDAVVAAKGHELFALLQIFLNDGLPEYKAWTGAHAGALAQYRKCPASSIATRCIAALTASLQHKQSSTAHSSSARSASSRLRRSS